MARFDGILRNLPKKPARSRLEPYSRLIKGLLHRGRTYREIAELLAENCNVHVSISTIHDFVRVRALPNQTAGTKRQTIVPEVSPTAAPRGEKNILSEEQPTAEEVYRRIQALKQRPVKVEQTPELFHYDPNEPLHLPDRIVHKKPGE